ncbi:histidine phosphatase family protein [Trinickia dinghuensis]|uniref:Histidine phosphatase family protein n=1 Tax=Trinickia dinghuensis TaxID=2291023 RepID=A0A3D8K1W8_9BURK|nr:histidine phosphatase family protein [Trinickia dinghuensis]RDU98571.1 histidine phosphatase family protein [Trinickia dinghuensis]
MFAVVLALGLSGLGIAQPASARTETLVFVRHGEKPAKGYGQLDCQGLNRAMALPAVIAAKFGKPDAIYAPNPSAQKKDNGVRYDYVRPLATIEPTAIQFTLPVNTDYGYSEIDKLEQALIQPGQAGKLIVTAWEHREIEDLVRDIVSKYGGGSSAASNVPYWHSSDFDSVYVVKLDWDAQGQAPRATFVHDHEGLDGRPKDCPCAALPDAPAAK